MRLFSPSCTTLSPAEAHRARLAQELDHTREKVPKNEAQALQLCHPKPSTHSSVWALPPPKNMLSCVNTHTPFSQTAKHRDTNKHKYKQVLCLSVQTDAESCTHFFYLLLQPSLSTEFIQQSFHVFFYLLCFFVFRIHPQHLAHLFSPFAVLVQCLLVFY